MLSVAISPCPNDTFIFGSWVLGLSAGAGEPARFLWADVEELNAWAWRGRCDVIKVSAVRAGELSGEYEVLSSGGAFGRGCGPKLAALPGSPDKSLVVAVPGLRTTAYALLRQALGPDFRALPVVYDQVLDAVRQGRADAGLLIHETALACDAHGLEVRLDLGRWWDGLGMGSPLPLGCIMARRSLGPDRIAAIDRAIRSSLEAARADRTGIWPLVRALARELDDATIERHIAAYVDEMSLDMGAAGQAALERLAGFVSIGAEKRDSGSGNP